jgi:hypothetical protein
MQTLHFPRRDLIAISVVPFHIARAQRPIVQPVSAGSTSIVIPVALIIVGAGGSPVR